MLGGTANIDVVGEATDGREVLAAVDLHHPDVVLMDLRMTELDGIAATRLLRSQPHTAAILVLTTFDIDELSSEPSRPEPPGSCSKPQRPARSFARSRTSTVARAASHLPSPGA